MTPASRPEAILDQVTASFPAIGSSSDDELFGLWVASGRELQRRNLVRSLGNVPADLAERVVERWSEGRRTAGSTPTVDVIGADGTRYQVKSVRRTDPGRNSVGTLSGFDFDELVVVVLEFDLSIRSGLRISSEDLRRHRDELLTGAEGRRLTLTRKFCAHPAVHPIPRLELARHHPLRAITDWEPPRSESVC
jgi:hypothetical protein